MNTPSEMKGIPRQWATAYEFPKVEDGHIVKEEIADGSPPTPSGIVFNLGREVLQDKRVREAVALAFNFEWTNESLQYGLFKQRASFSQDTPLMAMGVPEGDELAFLQGLGDVVAPEMLTEEVRVPHTSGARGCWTAAMHALRSSCWMLRVGLSAMMGNAVMPGEPLTLTFLVEFVWVSNVVGSC